MAVEAKKKGTYILKCLVFVVVLFIIVGFQIYLRNKQSKKIRILQFSRDIPANERINVYYNQDGSINESISDVKSYWMNMDEYTKLTSQSDATNDAVSRLVLYEESSRICGMYTNSYVYMGSMCRRNMFTKDSILMNPWLDNMYEEVEELDEKGNKIKKSVLRDNYEIYNMSFDASDMNQRLLVPGGKIRVRAVMNIDAQYVEEVKKQIQIREDTKIENPDGTVTYTMDPVLKTYAYMAKDNGDMTNLTGSVPVSEVIFDSIRITDMLNSSKESIFDIYMAMLALPVDQRAQLINTSVMTENTAFMQRVSPSSLVLVVNPKYATILTEFEKWSGIQLKYTILPDDSEDSTDNLLQQIRSVSATISSYTESYKAESLGD